MREQPVSDTSLSRTTEELELAHARYEYLRTLNPQQFKSLYERNIKGEGGSMTSLTQIDNKRRWQHDRLSQRSAWHPDRHAESRCRPPLDQVGSGLTFDGPNPFDNEAPGAIIECGELFAYARRETAKP